MLYVALDGEVFQEIAVARVTCNQARYIRSDQLYFRYEESPVIKQGTLGVISCNSDIKRHL